MAKTDSVVNAATSANTAGETALAPFSKEDRAEFANRVRTQKKWLMIESKGDKPAMLALCEKHAESKDAALRMAVKDAIVWATPDIEVPF